ncbi:MAG: hypothetical protein ACLUOF_02990 [Ruminococcus sp.]
MQTQIIYVSPLGNIRLTAEDDALIEAAFDVPATMSQSSTPFLESVCLWLDEYFQGKDPGAPPAICPKGTEFQLRIWRLAQQIRSAIRRPMARWQKRRHGNGHPEDVCPGGGRARNEIHCHLIPCHRVVGANGSWAAISEMTAGKSTC